MVLRTILNEVATMIEARIERILRRLRPAIQQDGGDVELVAVEGDVVKVRLTGTCLICPSREHTLKAGLEQAITAAVPEIRAVEHVS
ncbi:MAG: NifU family protein [Hydrogenibacillus schlegelii]|nr:NifU family protein [Hydrogenibacillus schlegelii]